MKVALGGWDVVTGCIAEASCKYVQFTYKSASWKFPEPASISLLVLLPPYSRNQKSERRPYIMSNAICENKKKIYKSLFIQDTFDKI